MAQAVSQPDARRLPDELIGALLRSLGEEGAGRDAEVAHRDAHSNDFAEVRLADGRTLVAKRGRYSWSRARFRTSRRASSLLSEQDGLVVPRPLSLPEGLPAAEGRPVEAYWRIDLPTLQDAWPSLGREARRSALRSWGELLARVHAVRLPGHGPLLDALGGGSSLVDFLARDLRDRLLPGIAGEWPDALPLVERLVAEIGTAARRARGTPRFLHGDVHMGNVLCRRDGDQVRCVGFLDLETAAAGPVEFDLANLSVLHGPLFDQELQGEWFPDVVRGYGTAPDAWLLAFFRAHHLLNLGFYSAFIGHHWHAAQVAREVRRVLSSLPQESTRSRAAVAGPPAPE